MSDTDQAQADLPEDEVTVLDPLDARNSTDSGTSELAEYEQEIHSLELSDPQPSQGVKPSNDEENTEHQEEEEPATEESETHEESSGQEEGGEEEQAREQMRPRLKDPLDIAVASLAKANGITLIEAAKIIERGKTPEPTPESEADQTQVETVLTVDAQLKELRAKHKEASTALEFEAAAEIFEQIEALRDKQVELRITEMQEKSRTEAQQAKEFDEKWDESTRKAVTFYPEAVKTDSAMAKRIQEIDAWMRDNGDPVYSSPDKPFILSKMAAAELGIPMARPQVKTPVKSTSKSPIEPASGNARTAPANPSKRVSEELDSLDSLDAFEAHVGAMSF